MMEAGPIGDRPRGWGRSSEMDWIDGITNQSLIERKLKMFPDDQRQVVSARVVMVGNAFRIEVASATLP
jgi:hypothetical protein